MSSESGGGATRTEMELAGSQSPSGVWLPLLLVVYRVIFSR